MKVLRVLRNLLIALAAIILVALLCVGGIWLYFHPRLEVTKGVVYGHRQGQDLTLDVLRPAHPNGIGIVLMASGGWKSEAGSFRHWIAAPILRRGYTVFAVYHIPQPKATVMEITEEVYRAVRFIRHNAAQYGVDPQRLGVTGGSSGGHLSLMMNVADAGGVILPPIPAFYFLPKTVDDLVNHTVGRVLDCFCIDHHLFNRWGSKKLKNALKKKGASD